VTVDASGAFETAEEMRTHTLRLWLAANEGQIARGMTGEERAEEGAVTAEVRGLLAKRERIAGLPAPVTRAESLEIVRDEVRDAYGRAFAAGGIVVVLAVPFSLTMRRRPADVHRGSEAAAAAAG